MFMFAAVNTLHEQIMKMEVTQLLLTESGPHEDINTLKISRWYFAILLGVSYHALWLRLDIELTEPMGSL